MHLILTVCLAASSSSCHEETIATEARLPMECTSAMAEWAVQHPKWRVVRWRCGVREVRA